MINLYDDFPCLKPIEKDIEKALEMLVQTYKNGGKLLCCGNGGSCADCEHIAGELMKGFLMPRRAGSTLLESLKQSGSDDAEYIYGKLQGSLPVISLPGQSAVLSAFANDVSADMAYAQLVYGYAKKEDMFLGISTSGNSTNVVYAAEVARALGIKTLALTGKKQSRLYEICDCAICVPETETYKIQQLHLPVYHYLCARLEASMFGNIK